MRTFTVIGGLLLLAIPTSLVVNVVASSAGVDWIVMYANDVLTAGVLLVIMWSVGTTFVFFMGSGNARTTSIALRIFYAFGLAVCLFMAVLVVGFDK